VGRHDDGQKKRDNEGKTGHERNSEDRWIG
jgi:hypothetical protein